MRRDVRHVGGVMALVLFGGLTLGGCSGQQQEDDSLEVTEDSEFEEGYNEASEEYANEEYANEEYANEEYANEGYDNSEYGNDEGMNEYGEYGGENLSNSNLGMEGANATENDLQEIIQEMNGQQAELTGDMGDALAQNMVSAPMDEGMDMGMGMDASMEAIPMDAPMNDAVGMNTAPMNTVGMNTAPMNAVPMAPSVAAPMSADSAVAFQPGGSPAGPALPELGSKMPYVVQPGDTLAKISMRIYGDVNRWNEMASLTGMSNPSRIYPGDVVYYTLDEAALAFSSAYESVARVEEVIQQGDTLATISRRVYGTSKGWKAIWRQNDTIDNPDMLQAGASVFYIQAEALTAAVETAKQNLTSFLANNSTDNSTQIETASLASNDTFTQDLVTNLDHFNSDAVFAIN